MGDLGLTQKLEDLRHEAGGDLTEVPLIEIFLFSTTKILVASRVPTLWRLDRLNISPTFSMARLMMAEFST